MSFRQRASRDSAHRRERTRRTKQLGLIIARAMRNGSSRPNDEVERRGAAPNPNGDDLSRSSIPSLAQRR
jgi:hypothetical protein